MFIGSFILNQSLQRPELRMATYLILYTPPLVLYMIWNRKKQFRVPTEHTHLSKKTASMNFQLIDAGIMNGFETLAKLGGYIILFAILAQMTTLLPIQNPVLKCLLIGFTEITNGIAYTAKQNFGFPLAYPLMMAYTAFGGLSGRQRCRIFYDSISAHEANRNCLFFRTCSFVRSPILNQCT